jgi:hypothetical protein
MYILNLTKRIFLNVVGLLNWQNLITRKNINFDDKILRSWYMGGFA